MNGAATAAADIAYQNRILPGVSRTFALTIPQMPAPLRHQVCNGYLLCRIADTVEDEPALTPAMKRRYLGRLARVVAGSESPGAFAGELHPRLSSATLPAEQELVANTPRIVRVTRGFPAPVRRPIERCVRVMASGMSEFQHGASARGLDDVPHLDRYCYHVAGVVGETITHLLCVHSREIAARQEALLALSASFGQALQMTNILKDMWEDYRRGVCWLPQDVFRLAGYDLRGLASGRTGPRFREGLLVLLGIARTHVGHAMRYILLIPPRHQDVRRFLLWTLGMSVLTLRRIHARPQFQRAGDVKISRRSVRAAGVTTRLLARSDRALDMLWRTLVRGLPAAPVAHVERPGEVAGVKDRF